MDAATIVGLLAETDRLRVFSALVLGARTPSDMAEATGLGPREVGRALQKLQAGGLVSDDLTVHADVFKLARAAEGPSETDSGVLGRFVRDGRLQSFPTQEAKRRLVLEHVAQSFEPGRRYPEREVDAVLKAWTEGGGTDHATLRRYLVDHQLLARDGGEYWRSGGWIDVLGG